MYEWEQRNYFFKTTIMLPMGYPRICGKTRIKLLISFLLLDDLVSSF